MTTATPDPADFVLAEATSFLFPAALRAAVELAIADALDEPATPGELATANGASAQHLYRILRLLATKGIFREDPEGRFHHTPASRTLRSDEPESVANAVLGLTSPLFWVPARRLADAARSGEPAFDSDHGTDLFSHFAANPADAAMFNRMVARFATGNDEIAEACPLPEAGTVVDVGGGVGGLLVEVLRRNPGLRGVLFELESALPDNVLGQLGDDSRVRTEVGDFFTAVPSADVHLLRYVLHDWNDQQCVRILRNCRRAMPAGGRVLVIDAALPSGNEPHFGKLLDLMMMVAVPGGERTEADFERLFSEADLRLTRVTPTRGSLSIIEGVPR